MELTHRPLGSSFLCFIFRILYGNPQKELLRDLLEAHAGACMEVASRVATLYPTYMPVSSSFRGLPYRILNIDHNEKELLRGLWVSSTSKASLNVLNTPPHGCRVSDSLTGLCPEAFSVPACSGNAELALQRQPTSCCCFGWALVFGIVWGDGFGLGSAG